MNLTQLQKERFIGLLGPRLFFLIKKIQVFLKIIDIQIAVILSLLVTCIQKEKKIL